MLSYKLVYIDSDYRKRPKNALAKLFKREGVHIANKRHVGSVSDETLHIMRKVNPNKSIIILNEFLPRDVKPLNYTPGHLFPFGAIYRRNAENMSVLETAEALRLGNFFLCVKGEEDRPATDDSSLEDYRSFERYEYRYHVSIDEVYGWRTKYRPYVNLERDSDSIGGSSWDGNLTSWYGSSPCTRMRYASEAGLYPQE